ncbi:Abi family protein [Weissella viridescens]|uniref:Abi family protein n=1 Tax=Weissella viridescens TaxID=1629 RepID=UPI003AF2B21C
MGEPRELTYDQQLDLLEQRGMVVSANNRQSPSKMETIGYYKIKEFANPYFINNSYNGVELGKIVTRFYHDKNMRMHILHAIEKIEISLKIKVAYYMGNKYGAYGYLTFNNWYNRNRCTPEKMRERQIKFRTKLEKSVRRSSNPDVTNRNNLNEYGQPTVWLGINLLMFGDLEFLIKNMNRSALTWLAKQYNLDSYQELLSMVGLIHFVRNICCHNSNLVDTQYITVPSIREEWKPLLFETKNVAGETIYSNHLSIAIVVIKYLVDQINPQYQWSEIGKDLVKLGKPVRNDNKTTYEYLGFKSINSIRELFANDTKALKAINRAYSHIE